MFKNLISFLSVLALFLPGCSKKTVVNETTQKPTSSFYDLKATTIDGKEISMSNYKGKNILIVNTASKCGYTYQYEGLEALHKKYGKDVAILGFPANDFFGQEPGSNEKIEQFCKLKYDVTFQMFEKITVKGKNMSAIYQWLTKPELNGWNSQKPSWNFSKYFIDRQGNLVAYFGPKVEPLSSEITDLIK